MVEIKEFQPLVYNQYKLEKLKIKFQDIICPPYDVISETQHKSLLKKKYNFVNLEFPAGKEKVKYVNAKKLLNLWIRNKILIKEELPSIYLHQHTFSYPAGSNIKYTRTGIFCLVKSDPEYKNILPHELTKPKPVEDRTNLINALKIQTSPPFFVVEDKDRRFYRTILQMIKPQYLVINFTDETGAQHKLYRIVEGTEKIEELKKIMKNKKLYIADGHHRYKVTSEYLKKIKKEFLMGYICSLSDEGLLILPTHRAISGTHIIEELKKYFNLVSWDGKSKISMAVYHNGEFKVLKLKEKFYQKYKKEKLLDNSYFLLDRILCELEGEQIRQQIYYHQEMKEVTSFAEKYNGCAFIMPAITKQEFVSIVDKGEIFPPKTTYFYPKVPCGFVIYDIEF
ncbi:MAG: DUF1015 domain-containing protein [Endomicrobia bacterium]|nr:DUF1015 domain-containing protein [Endomicrobiia bacterium]MCX7715850.1 DUF1015 domain-containing protein [Endomicrobiia bacterium]